MKLSRYGMLGSTIALFITAVALAQSYPNAVPAPPHVSAVSPTDLFQDIAKGQPSTTNVYATAPQVRSYVLGQSNHLTAPTLTTSTTVCGGSTATVSGTDTSGQIAEGSSASTSCVVTFATAFVTAPECFVSIDNVTDSSLKCATSTTALTITKSSAASEKINYLILGLSGG